MMPIRFLGFAILVGTMTLGCGTQVDIPSASAVPQPVSLSPEALARLEEADKLDGKADHVICKCYICNLGMDGSDKYAVQVEGYTAHLCSKFCQKEFEGSTEEVVLKTEIPKETDK